MPPKRPEMYSPEIITAAFGLWWPKVERWLKQGGDRVLSDDKENAFHVISDYCHMTDGFQIAREFDHSGWAADEDFVVVCSEWADCVFSAHRKAVEAWVKSGSIKPKMAIGTKVKFKYNFKVHENGEITDIDLVRGQYTVFCKEVGHVPAGNTGVNGVHILFEDLEVLNGH